jgi:hypothetical protein
MYRLSVKYARVGQRNCFQPEQGLPYFALIGFAGSDHWALSSKSEETHDEISEVEVNEKSNL